MLNLNNDKRKDTKIELKKKPSSKATNSFDQHFASKFDQLDKERNLSAESIRNGSKRDNSVELVRVYCSPARNAMERWWKM